MHMSEKQSEELQRRLQHRLSSELPTRTYQPRWVDELRANIASEMLDVINGWGEPMPTSIADLTDSSARWHAARYPDHTQWLQISKLLEEAGELARAAIGQHEQRPHRGDVVEEAAQTILVVMTIIGRWYPEDAGERLQRAILNELGAKKLELARHEAQAGG